MKNKTTIQDVADSLNLSRVTVSKVLNNAAGVSEDTRQAVLQKAKELHYKGAGQTASSSQARGTARSFAFLMHSRPDDLHVGSSIMTQLEREIRKEGFSLTIHTISDEDLQRMELPANLYLDQTQAIVCLELFHAEYSRLLCSLKMPVLFIDACYDFYSLKLDCSLLMMESRSSVCQMLSALHGRHGIDTMGYVGDIRHCLSFRERYEGFQLAASDCNIETEPFNIIDDDSLYSNSQWLGERIQKMDRIPRLFFCANDVLAQNLILELEKAGYRIPQDILICGFDGIPTKNPIISRLTTVCTPSLELGTAAAQLLIQKLRTPDIPNASTYLQTSILFRSSAP